jgi:hypothetical protein
VHANSITQRPHGSAEPNAVRGIMTSSWLAAMRLSLLRAVLRAEGNRQQQLANCTSKLGSIKISHAKQFMLELTRVMLLHLWHEGDEGAMFYASAQRDIAAETSKQDKKVTQWSKAGRTRSFRVVTKTVCPRQSKTTGLRRRPGVMNPQYYTVRSSKRSKKILSNVCSSTTCMTSLHLPRNLRSSCGMSHAYSCNVKSPCSISHAYPRTASSRSGWVVLA